jgi:hypothetical protein
MPDPYPLSHAQNALWSLHRLAPGSAAHNMAIAVGVRSVLDISQLRFAVAELGKRHDMLRSTFTEAEGRPVRLVGENGLARLEVRSGRGVSDDGVRRIVREALLAPFALETDGAFRVVLVRRSAEDAVLLVAGHHIATDATTAWLVARDLLQIYHQVGHGRGPGLPPLASGYDDYVTQERRFLASPRGDRAARHWARLCEGSTPAVLPPDRPRGATPSFTGSTRHVLVPAEVVGRLLDAARRASVTPFAFLLAAFQATLHRTTRQRDFLVGCPATARLNSKMRDVAGNFVNTLVFRARIGPTTTFRDAALAVNEQVKTGINGVRYPFPLLARPCGIMFNLLSTTHVDKVWQPLLDMSRPDRHSRYGDLLLTPHRLPQQEGQFDLTVDVTQSRDSLSVDFRYDTALFDASTIDGLAADFVRTAEIAVVRADTRIATARP